MEAEAEMEAKAIVSQAKAAVTTGTAAERAAMRKQERLAARQQREGGGGAGGGSGPAAAAQSPELGATRLRIKARTSARAGTAGGKGTPSRRKSAAAPRKSEFFDSDDDE